MWQLLYLISPSMTCANWFDKTVRLTGITGPMLTFFSARLRLQECLNPDIRLDHTWGETAKIISPLISNMLTQQDWERMVHHVLQDIYPDYRIRGRDTPPHVVTLAWSQMEINNKFLLWKKKEEVYISLNERTVCCHQSFLFWDSEIQMV